MKILPIKNISYNKNIRLSKESNKNIVNFGRDEKNSSKKESFIQGFVFGALSFVFLLVSIVGIGIYKNKKQNKKLAKYFNI